ncbi:MAG TPA: aldo/keto reductase [Herpetosiphonaceae bacterium]
MTTPFELPPRSFGQTGLFVTPLAIGCAQLGDMPDTFAFSVAEEQALATLRAALHSPINFLDTAAAYGDGESERRIGIVLRELGGLPPGAVLATKADRDLQSGDFSGEQIKRSIERSLRLLGLEYLQVVYLHDPEHTTFEQVMASNGPLDVLVRLRDEGVIGHLGIAGGPIDLMMRYVETGAFAAVITHNRYTLVNRTAEPLLDLAAGRGLAVVNAAPYGSGMLAKGPGSYARYAYQDASPALVEVVQQMQAVCERHNVPLAAAALHFSLRDPRITSTIVGMSKPERIAQTLDLVREPVPDALWAELAQIQVPRDDPEADRW